MVLRSDAWRGLVLAASMWSGGWVPVGETSPEKDGRFAQETQSGPAAERAVAWIENQGQWPGAARFVATFPEMLVGIEPEALALILWRQGLRPTLVRLEWQGCSPVTAIEGEEDRGERYHFFLGNDPEKWQRNLRAFERVRCKALYPGVDLVLRSVGGKLEYDLELAPGADIERILVHCSGAERLTSGDRGGLILETVLGPLEQALGRAWEIDEQNQQKPVACTLKRIDECTFGFAAPDWNRSRPLVIDPSLAWSTYLGTPYPIGLGDGTSALEIAPSGEIVLTGVCGFPGFPQTPGDFENAARGNTNIFVAKLDPNGERLLYSAILGGDWSSQQVSNDLALDGQGRPVVVGYTFSRDFPTTARGFDPLKTTIGISAFAFRLSSDGSELEYSTFLEGQILNDGSEANGVTIDPATGAAVVVGWAGPTFPVSSSAFDQTSDGVVDGFIARLSPDGSSLEWSSFIGGLLWDDVREVAADAAGNLTIVGSTESEDFPTTPGSYQDHWVGWQFYEKGFVAKVAPDGTHLIWSSYIGAFNGPWEDYAHAVALDPTGAATVIGFTRRPDFPTTPGAFQEIFNFDPNYLPGDVFVTRFAPDGASVLYSTFLGGVALEYPKAVHVDASGIATVLVESYGTFPTTPGGYQVTSPGNIEFAVARLDPQGAHLFYSTYLSGPNTDIPNAMDIGPDGRIVVGGSSNGGYPTTPQSYDPTYNGGAGDAVVAAFDPLLEGLTWHGESTPSCHGPLLILGTELPAAGSTSFSLVTSAAPPSASGWLLIGRAIAMTPIIVGGAQLWIAPNGPVVRLPVQADAQGYVGTLLAALPATVGVELSAQYLFPNPAACGQGTALCASNALLVQTQ